VGRSGKSLKPAPQLMGSVHEKLSKCDLRYLQYAFGRAQDWPIKKIIKELDDPDIESPQVLYQRLARDGYPVCPVCGEAPVQQNHCQETIRGKPGAGAGKYEELTSPPRAEELFRGQIEALLSASRSLYNTLGYQDRRFVGAHVYEVSALFPRKVYSEKQWREICERYSHDPSVDEREVKDATLQVPAGAEPSPPEPLTTLIGVYALAGGDMEALLKALHPGAPSKEKRERVRKCVEGKKKRDGKDGLRSVTEELAKLVLGDEATGRPPVGLSTIEHDAACYITQLRGEGRSDEEILTRLRNHRMSDGSELTAHDVSRLGNLRLRYSRG
jgi:hypothetical protein